MDDSNNPFEYDLEALGDFPPSADTQEILQEAQALVVPSATRSVSLAASDGFSSYLGLGTARNGADIDVSLWPASTACELALSTDGCEYPGSGSGYGMGVSSDGNTLLIAGGDVRRENDDAHTRAVASTAAVVDLATSKVTCLSGNDGLQVGRRGATVTPLDELLLVAGGIDPAGGDSVVETAELFDPATRTFASDPIPLVPRGRARHGAVALASNEVLLVGGIDQRGPISEGTLYALAPAPPYRRTNLAELPAPRIDPVVLRLSDDRIFVAGGTDGTDANEPLQDLVWLSSTARSIDNQLSGLSCPGDQVGETPTVTVESAFASMPGGAVLAAGGCALRLDGKAPSCDAPCHELGCPSSEVFWIDRDGAVTCCGSGRSTCSGPPSKDPPPGFSSPRLIAGEEGRPWLLEGDDPNRTLRRFDPWTGQFPLAGIVTSGNFATTARADAGLFLSLDDCSDETHPEIPCTAALHGFRFGVRGQYTQAIAPLLLADTDGVAMDRALSPPPAAGAGASRPYRDSASGYLELTAGAEVFLTDTTYDGIDLVIPVHTGAPPLIHLGTTLFGGKACPWPLSSPQPPFDAELTRHGDAVTLSIQGHVNNCDGPTGRVAIAVGTDTFVSFKSIAVTRTGG